MTWKPLSRTNREYFLQALKSTAWRELLSVPAIVESWRYLIDCPGFAGVVIEADDGRVVGVGARVFVTERFADAEIGSPRSGLNRRLCSDASSVVLPGSAIAAANSGEGLNVVVLCGCWVKDISPDEARDVRHQLESSFVQLHSGYRFRRMITELMDSQDVEYAVSSRLWRLLSQPYLDCQGSVLAVIERSDLTEFSGSILSQLFFGRPPKLQLRPTDQELLCAALEGWTDKELVLRLGRKLPSIKRRWAALFNRVERSCPDLLTGINGDQGVGRRGPQKRHHLLSYVRQRPEELRPYLHGRSRSASGH